jgi:putative proteasome-type protease
MTYCVAMRLNAGLVFLSDSRTNAGVDQVGTFRKMTVYENPGERVMVMLSAGNLSLSQTVRQLVGDYVGANGETLWTVPSMHAAARLVGDAIRTVHQRDAQALRDFGIDFNVSIIFGGQIKGERCRLFQLYSAGNFIEAHAENPYFQIGEAKYGKPIIDRIVTPASSLDEAAKCALVSMDSTLRSNISVGLPLDLLAYEADSLKVTRCVTIDEQNAYFQMIQSSWGQRLRAVFGELADPPWQGAQPAAAPIAMPTNLHSQPPRVPLPPDHAPASEPAPLQSLAGQQGRNQD